MDRPEEFARVPVMQVLRCALKIHEIPKAKRGDEKLGEVPGVVQTERWAKLPWALPHPSQKSYQQENKWQEMLERVRGLEPSQVADVAVTLCEHRGNQCAASLGN